ncbi:MAG: regulatory protein GemA, partial [Acetobacteraceae bacterium]|nr:regulatory protein GemA [Acetobacteraceae bacterium]
MPNPRADGGARRVVQKRTGPPPRATHPAADPERARKGAIAKVHIARSQLGMGDDAYRDLLERVTGARTAGALAVAQLEAVLKEMVRLGFKPVPARRPMSVHAQIRMIHAVWADLKPHLSDGSEAALRAFVQRQTKSPKHPTGVSAPEFCGPAEANKVLEGLKAWLAR